MRYEARKTEAQSKTAFKLRDTRRSARSVESDSLLVREIDDPSLDRIQADLINFTQYSIIRGFH